MQPKIVDSIDFWPHCDVCKSRSDVQRDDVWTRKTDTGEQVPVLLCATCRKDLASYLDRVKDES